MTNLPPPPSGFEGLDRPPVASVPVESEGLDVAEGSLPLLPPPPSGFEGLDRPPVASVPVESEGLDVAEGSLPLLPPPPSGFEGLSQPPAATEPVPLAVDASVAPAEQPQRDPAPDQPETTTARSRRRKAGVLLLVAIGAVAGTLAISSALGDNDENNASAVATGPTDDEGPGEPATGSTSSNDEKTTSADKSVAEASDASTTEPPTSTADTTTAQTSSSTADTTSIDSSSGAPSAPPAESSSPGNIASRTEGAPNPDTTVADEPPPTTTSQAVQQSPTTTLAAGGSDPTPTTTAPPATTTAPPATTTTAPDQAASISGLSTPPTVKAGQPFTVTFTLNDPDGIVDAVGVHELYNDSGPVGGADCQSVANETTPGKYFVQLNCVAEDWWPGGRYRIEVYADVWGGLCCNLLNGNFEVVADGDISISALSHPSSVQAGDSFTVGFTVTAPDGLKTARLQAWYSGDGDDSGMCSTVSANETSPGTYAVQVSCSTSERWSEPIGFWAFAEDSDGDWFESDGTGYVEIVPV